MVHYKNGTTIKEDPKNGEFMVYYDTGLPKSIYHYKDGKKDGSFIEYYNKGEKVLVPREKDDPYEPDEMEEVLQGQQISHQGNYKNGVLVGEEIFYDENGRITDKKVHSN